MSFVLFINATNLQLILCLTDLQDTTVALDFRVTTLEENGGGDGNSSVAELEVRVETLKATAADHETRISDTESDVTGKPIITFSNRFMPRLISLEMTASLIFLLYFRLGEVVTLLETRLTAAEENIQGILRKVLW